MAKAKKENQAVEKQAAVNPESESIQEPATIPESVDSPGSVMSGQPIQVEFPRDRLFDLYLARVAKAETVNTMRRDGRAIFRDAFIEARVALDVFQEMTTGVRSL